jgi:tRNA(fMet)-specific endonuclease VapC
MGLILDSDPIIAAERRALTVRGFLQELRKRYGDDEVIGFSTVTLVELSHGIARANTESRRQSRQLFVDELLRDIPSYPLTAEIARLAGRIEGDGALRGVLVLNSFLLEGATDIRHFSEADVVALLQSHQILGRDITGKTFSSIPFRACLAGILCGKIQRTNGEKKTSANCASAGDTWKATGQRHMVPV